MLAKPVWEGILIHHSFSKDHGTLDWDNVKVWHVRDNNWRDIAYHNGIEVVEDTIQILRGRSLLERGAHGGSVLNKTHIGICVIGNFDLVAPGPEIYAELADLCTEYQAIFRIPKEKIEPHSKYSEKTCPGKLFDMNELYKRLK